MLNQLLILVVYPIQYYSSSKGSHLQAYSLLGVYLDLIFLRCFLGEVVEEREALRQVVVLLKGEQLGLEN